MLDRLKHWPSTGPGLAILVFLAFAVWIRPTLLDNPLSLIPLGLGLMGLFSKGSTGANK